MWYLVVPKEAVIKTEKLAPFCIWKSLEINGIFKKHFIVCNVIITDKAYIAYKAFKGENFDKKLVIELSINNDLSYLFIILFQKLWISFEKNKLKYFSFSSSFALETEKIIKKHVPHYPFYIVVDKELEKELSKPLKKYYSLLDLVYEVAELFERELIESEAFFKEMKKYDYERDEVIKAVKTIMKIIKDYIKSFEV